MPTYLPRYSLRHLDPYPYPYRYRYRYGDRYRYKYRYRLASHTLPYLALLLDSKDMVNKVNKVVCFSWIRQVGILYEMDG